MKNFSQKLQFYRDKAELMPAEVATILHVEPQTVADWELGKSYPDYDMLIKISNLYQVSIDTLLKNNEQANNLLNRDQARKDFYISISFSWILCGLFNYYQSTIAVQGIKNTDNFISLLVSIFMVIIAYYQISQGPLFYGVSKNEYKRTIKPIWHDPLDVCLILLIVVPIIISAFTSDFVAGLIRGTLFVGIGIVDIILSIRDYRLTNNHL